MGIFKELFKKFLCCHDWELWKEVRVKGDSGEYYYYVYHFKCKKCDKFKNKKLR